MLNPGDVSSASCLSLVFFLLFHSAIISLKKMREENEGSQQVIFFTSRCSEEHVTKGKGVAVMMPNSALSHILSDNLKLVSVR